MAQSTSQNWSPPAASMQLSVQLHVYTYLTGPMVRGLGRNPLKVESTLSNNPNYFRTDDLETETNGCKLRVWVQFGCNGILARRPANCGKIVWKL